MLVCSMAHIDCSPVLIARLAYLIGRVLPNNSLERHCKALSLLAVGGDDTHIDARPPLLPRTLFQHKAAVRVEKRRGQVSLSLRGGFWVHQKCQCTRQLGARHVGGCVHSDLSNPLNGTKSAHLVAHRPPVCPLLLSAADIKQHVRLEQCVLIECLVGGVDDCRGVKQPVQDRGISDIVTPKELVGYVHWYSKLTRATNGFFGFSFCSTISSTVAACPCTMQISLHVSYMLL